MEVGIWNNSDKDFLKKRKEEWRNIKINLNVMADIIPRSVHKYHKELYFSGTIHPDILDVRVMNQKQIERPFNGAPLFFKMWYYPEFDPEYFSALFEEETEFYNLNQARELLFQFGQELFGSDYGMLGGREEIIVKTLYPSTDYKQERTHFRQKLSLSMSPGTLMRLCSPSTKALLSYSYINPFVPGQYLWDHLAFCLENYHDECFETQKQIDRFRSSLRSIIDFYDRKDAPVDRAAAKNHRDYLYSRFDARDFPNKLTEYWDQEKLVYEAG
jgi:hypothetical protein